MNDTVQLIHAAQATDLPPGWFSATIEDLVGADGLFVDGDWVDSKDQDPTGDVRLIQLADIGDGEYRDKSDRFLTHKKGLELGCTFLNRDDVLIARMPDPLGRACIFPGDRRKSVTVVDVAIARSGKGEFNHRWLMYFINAPAFRTSVASLQSGSTRKRISRGNLARITLPVPPREHQDCIVAEIEKQFSRLDEAVVNLKRVKANLKRYKAAVLKVAVEGKFTEDWRKQHPDVEPASILLDRILAERRAKWKGKGKYKEPAVPSSANLLPFPPGWCLATLDQTFWQLRSGTAETSRRKLTEYPVLKSSAVRQGTIDFSDLNYLQELQSMRPENFLKLGDFLITRLSGSVDYVGCSAVVKSRLCEGIQYPDRIFCGKLLTGVDGTYLSYCFQHPMIRKILEGAAKSTAGHQRISMSDLYPLTLPLPPTAEQMRIVAEVERRLSVIEELESTVQANLTRADRLRQSVLANAFAGKLFRASRRKVSV